MLQQTLVKKHFAGLVAFDVELPGLMVLQIGLGDQERISARQNRMQKCKETGKFHHV